MIFSSVMATKCGYIIGTDIEKCIHTIRWAQTMNL